MLLKRPLSAFEIEPITRQVMAGQPVFGGELPATSFYKYLAVNGSDQFAEKMPNY
ncbi:MAG: hypothetical protein J7501_15275 [Bdellovibrio sp.]|nr:hypothetical protein [Bdellovibrio sp.]